MSPFVNEPVWGKKKMGAIERKWSTRSRTEREEKERNEIMYREVEKRPTRAYEGPSFEKLAELRGRIKGKSKN